MRPWHHPLTGLKWLGIFMLLATLVLSLWMSRGAFSLAQANRAWVLDRIQKERQNPPLTEARVQQVVREEIRKAPK